jgi:hypothetical protein
VYQYLGSRFCIGIVFDGSEIVQLSNLSSIDLSIVSLAWFVRFVYVLCSMTGSSCSNKCQQFPYIWHSTTRPQYCGIIQRPCRPVCSRLPCIDPALPSAQSPFHFPLRCGGSGLDSSWALGRFGLPVPGSNDVSRITPALMQAMRIPYHHLHMLVRGRALWRMMVGLRDVICARPFPTPNSSAFRLSAIFLILDRSALHLL